MNQYIVLVLDALLHLGAILLLAALVSFTVKLFSRGHVDFRFFSGLLIIFVIGSVQLYLESNLEVYLPEMTPDIIFGIMLSALVIIAAFLIYWQYSVPLFGSLVSAVFVVALQAIVSLAVPQLSYHLMPEGQRFAEYAGLATAQTSQLMQRAKNFENEDGPSVWQKALSVAAFFSDEEETSSIHRDFTAGIEVYKERKALMDDMSDEELAAYRQAMSEFLKEQGLSDYSNSLKHLETVEPEVLVNMASFMNEMNAEFGRESVSSDEAIPSSLDSLDRISKNLDVSELNTDQKEKFEKILALINQDDLAAGLESARAELARLKKNVIEEGGASHTTQIVEGILTVSEIENNESLMLRDLTEYTSYSMQFGVLRVPPTISDTKDWIEVAKAIPCKAWFIGEGEESVATVVMQEGILRIGDQWITNFNDKRYAVRLDAVSETGLQLSAVE
jgi:hypothetical protein